MKSFRIILSASLFVVCCYRTNAPKGEVIKIDSTANGSIDRGPDGLSTDQPEEFPTAPNCMDPEFSDPSEDLILDLAEPVESRVGYLGEMPIGRFSIWRPRSSTSFSIFGRINQ